MAVLSFEIDNTLISKLVDEYQMKKPKDELGFDEYGEENLFSNGGIFTNNGKLLLYVTDENAKVFVNDGKFANKGELYLNGKEGNRLVAINNGSFINDGDLNLNMPILKTAETCAIRLHPDSLLTVTSRVTS